MDNELDRTLVIINGSGMVQCGFSDEDSPRALFPNCYGHPKNPGIMVGGDMKREFVGDEAILKLGILIVRRSIPIDGSPLNFRYLEETWYHTFYNELRVSPEERRVIMTDLPNMDDVAYEKMSEILFERFNVPALEIANPSVLSTFEYGVESGLVVDSGFGGTRIVPVYEGYAVEHASMKMEIEEFKKTTQFVGMYRKESTMKKVVVGVGGDLIKRHLIDLLFERGYEMTTRGEQFLMADVKEKICYFENDYETGLLSQEEKEKVYELPDGTEMKVGSQAFRACEIMFKPQILFLGRLSGQKRKDQNCEDDRKHGVHEYIEQAIKKCDPDLHDLMYDRIFLTGGNTLIPNFDCRLESEMKKLQVQRPLKIHSSPTREYGSWLGGKVLSELSPQHQNWIEKKYYEEVGPVGTKRISLRSFRFPESEVFFSSLDSKDPDLPERVEFVKNDVDKSGKTYRIVIKERMGITVPFKILFLM